jgi:hypothetical protein
MSERFWHEVCFTGPKDIEPLIDAAEAAGYSFEFGGTDPDETLVGTAVQLDEARAEIGRLRTHLTEYILKELEPGIAVVLLVGDSERRGRLLGLRNGIVYLEGDAEGIPLAAIDNVLLEMSTEGPE